MGSWEHRQPLCACKNEIEINQNYTITSIPSPPLGDGPPEDLILPAAAGCGQCHVHPGTVPGAQGAADGGHPDPRGGQGGRAVP